MIALLIGAAVIAALLDEVADAIAVGAIVILNAIVGYLQEARAERAMQALKALTAPRARVIRDGKTIQIAASEIVVGDLLAIEAGDVVGADARLVEANVLTTNEAILTGESLPVEKEAEAKVFAGTAVATGTGVAEVFGTAMSTELGKIARLLETAEVEETPLQKRLEHVGKTLIWMCLAIVAVVAGLGLARGMKWIDVLLSSVSLAVAAVPEGLAAVVTIALALGVQRMVARNVLIRRLPAVETLGCATVICTDKTGTLTTGVMAVRETRGDERRVLDAAAACCDAELGGPGDPTELAILEAAAKLGISRPEIERARPRVRVEPFDSKTKRMSIARADGVTYVKGAPEAILPKDHALVAEAAEMAGRGLRVLAVALGEAPLGLVGIADPPRADAVRAVADARAAGIHTVMITGDHPATARAIANELGIVAGGEDPAELVHARATPEDKIKIVRGWKKKGAIVAMTGDGVNDAPALREAHIGVAVGKGASEVAREASAMIITDENFASIVAAVREGRGIYDNIRKTLVYLLSGNFGELLIMLGASVAGMPLPLLPLQLLWINLLTDGLPALALVTDPPDSDVLARPPRRPDEKMLGRRQWSFIVTTGVLMAAIVLGAFTWGLHHGDLKRARSLAFSVIVFDELLRSFSARSETKIFWEVGAFTNLRLLGVVAGSMVVQLVVLCATGASPATIAIALACGATLVTLLEVAKLVRRGLAKVREPSRAVGGPHIA
jgi:Ca2+-transporting ATPase